MSLKIKPAADPPPMTRLSVRIPAPTAAMLSAYQKAYEQTYHKPIDGGFIVNEILQSFFNADKEFQEFLKKNPDLLTAVAEKPAQQNKPTAQEG
jgi:hypothetical protein